MKKVFSDKERSPRGTHKNVKSSKWEDEENEFAAAEESLSLAGGGVFGEATRIPSLAAVASPTEANAANPTNKEQRFEERAYKTSVSRLLQATQVFADAGHAFSKAMAQLGDELQEVSSTDWMVAQHLSQHASHMGNLMRKLAASHERSLGVVEEALEEPIFQLVELEAQELRQLTEYRQKAEEEYTHVTNRQKKKGTTASHASDNAIMENKLEQIRADCEQQAAVLDTAKKIKLFRLMRALIAGEEQFCELLTLGMTDVEPHVERMESMLTELEAEQGKRMHDGYVWKLSHKSGRWKRVWALLRNGWLEVRSDSKLRETAAGGKGNQRRKMNMLISTVRLSQGVRSSLSLVDGGPAGATGGGGGSGSSHANGAATGSGSSVGGVGGSQSSGASAGSGGGGGGVGGGQDDGANNSAFLQPGEKFEFEILTPERKRPWVLAVRSEAERQRWIDAIQASIGSLINNQQLGGGGGDEEGVMRRSKGGLLPSAVSSGGGGAGGLGMAIIRKVIPGKGHRKSRSVTSAETARQMALLQMQEGSDNSVMVELAVVPGNAFCVDCGKPDPDWASMNLGVLFCLNCSGVHRHLGSHITKVRSLTMDKWPLGTVRYMKCIGNKRANEFWEARLDHASPAKPKPSSSQQERIDFITHKYDKKSFAVECKQTRAELTQAVFRLIRECEPLTELVATEVPASAIAPIKVERTASGSGLLRGSAVSATPVLRRSSNADEGHVNALPRASKSAHSSPSSSVTEVISPDVLEALQRASRSSSVTVVEDVLAASKVAANGSPRTSGGGPFLQDKVHPVVWQFYELLAWGADLNGIDNGRTIPQALLEKGDPWLLHIFAVHGSELGVVEESSGENLLHFAARHNLHQCLDVLFTFLGASASMSLHAKNHANETPIDVAKSAGSAKVLEEFHARDTGPPAGITPLAIDLASADNMRGSHGHGGHDRRGIAATTPDLESGGKKSPRQSVTGGGSAQTGGTSSASSAGGGGSATGGDGHVAQEGMLKKIINKATGGHARSKSTFPAFNKHDGAAAGQAAGATPATHGSGGLVHSQSSSATSGGASALSAGGVGAGDRGTLNSSGGVPNNLPAPRDASHGGKMAAQLGKLLRKERRQNSASLTSKVSISPEGSATQGGTGAAGSVIEESIDDDDTSTTAAPTTPVRAEHLQPYRKSQTTGDDSTPGAARKDMSEVVVRAGKAPLMKGKGLNMDAVREAREVQPGVPDADVHESKDVLAFLSSEESSDEGEDGEK